MLIPILCGVGGFAIWYVTYGATCALNGATMWAHPIFMPFQCLWQEITWVAPGGLARRAKFIKDEVICVNEDGHYYDGAICGSRVGPDGILTSWRHKEVVENDLYAECAKDVLPGYIHFTVQHIIVPLLPLGIWAICHFR